MLRVIIISFIVLLGACSDGNDNHTPPLGVEVELNSGNIIGQDHPESNVWEWLAIPFAEAPKGDLRWKAPRDITPWKGTRETKTFGSECPQVARSGKYIGDEDCLHLNIWRPRSEERDLPVYVWIHGGANITGSNSLSIYQGDRLAQNSNVVVVSIQYRMGPLGWFNFSPLHSGNAIDDSGNYGILDIIQSLEWIKDNIESFGGDYNNVTITGESAGAQNIINLLLSDLATGLFHKAIVQSGFPLHTTLEDAQASAQALFDDLVQDVTAPSEDEIAGYLLSVSAEDIIRAKNKNIYSGITDGTVLPTEGISLFETAEHANKVPMIIGTNKDEYKLWTSPLMFNILADKDPVVIEGVGRYASDMWRVVGADAFATNISAAADQPNVYLYRFNWGSPKADGLSPLPVPFGLSLGAHHVLEIPFVLGNWEECVIPELTPVLFTEDSAAGRENLSAAIMAYFSAFAHSGDPHTANQTAWEPFTVEGDFKAIEFDVNLNDNSASLTVDNEALSVKSVLADMHATIDEKYVATVELLVSTFIKYQ